MQDRFGYLQLAAALVGAVVVAGAIVWLLPASGSYNQCIVDGMRDKPQSMYLTVSDYCHAKYPK